MSHALYLGLLHFCICSHLYHDDFLHALRPCNVLAHECHLPSLCSRYVVNNFYVVEHVVSQEGWLNSTVARFRTSECHPNCVLLEKIFCSGHCG